MKTLANISSMVMAGAVIAVVALLLSVATALAVQSGSVLLIAFSVLFDIGFVSLALMLFALWRTYP